MRGARLHVMAIRSPENGGTGAVKETTLDGLIRTSTGPGWQEQLRKAVQAHRLEGHPLCGSMRIFLEDIKKICNEMQSTSPPEDISRDPILNLVCNRRPRMCTCACACACEGETARQGCTPHAKTLHLHHRAGGERADVT